MQTGMCHGHIWYSGTLHGQNTPSELFSTRYEQNSGRNTGTEAVKTVKNSKFQIHVNGLKILKSKKSCLLLLRRSKHDFLDLLRSWYKFCRYIQFFKVNLKILRLITRKILGQNLNKYDTELFYLILNWVSSEYRWPELNTGQQCICDDFL